MGFLWRAVHNSVPILGNLYKKKLTNNALCPICMQDVETIKHALPMCKWTQAACFTWTPRAGNTLAHELARVAGEGMLPQDWVQLQSSWMKQMIADDAAKGYRARERTKVNNGIGNENTGAPSCGYAQQEHQ
ncbi:hypothetical protein PIB30_086859 [Stylosanthes scabra]|uniref:Reverse transcriptase zinc-binding domain-containing protein n=1 Tax=Stylosanthes scabra TaxID=79078 RepID=A0ABU6WSW6_9FABA|nr:hypothetical protein [Stylosanthes scabra]